MNKENLINKLLNGEELSSAEFTFAAQAIATAKEDTTQPDHDQDELSAVFGLDFDTMNSKHNKIVDDFIDREGDQRVTEGSEELRKLCTHREIQLVFAMYFKQILKERSIKKLNSELGNLKDSLKDAGIEGLLPNIDGLVDRIKKDQDAREGTDPTEPEDFIAKMFKKLRGEDEDS
jgi:hypothetical protein